MDENNVLRLDGVSSLIAVAGRKVYRILCGCGGLFEQVDVSGNIYSVDDDSALDGMSIILFKCPKCGSSIVVEYITQPFLKREKAREMLREAYNVHDGITSRESRTIRR